MIISEFNYTPRGHFDFIDSDGNDVTGEITLHFETGELISNYNHKFIKIPEKLWGKRKIYLTDKEGKYIYFDKNIIQKYYTNETDDKISYVLFQSNSMFFGIFPNQKMKTESLHGEVSFKFVDGFLSVQLPFEFLMPYFFEIDTANKSFLVDFIKQDKNSYLLDLTDIDLDEIESIHIQDHEFKKQINYLIYEKDDRNFKFSNGTFNKNGCFITSVMTPIIGQLGASHFKVDENFTIDENFVRGYKNQNDQVLELFTVSNGRIIQLNYETSPDFNNNAQSFTFKNSIVIVGYRRVKGNIKQKIVNATELPVDLANVSNDGVDLVFPRELLTVQIIKTTSNLNGPFSEITNTLNGNVVNIALKDIFNDLGLKNGVKNMLIFASVSFKGEHQSELYRLNLVENSLISNDFLFDKRIILEGGIGKYRQYVQLFRNGQGNITFLKGPLHNLVKQTFNLTVQVENIERQEETYKLSLKLVGDIPNNFILQSVRLINRNVLDPKENNYFVENIYKEANAIYFDTMIDLEHSYVPFYWDLFVVIGDENSFIPIQVDKLSENVKKLIDIDVFSKEIRSSHNTILYPYVTAGGSLAFTYRNVESYENTVNFKKEEKGYKIYNSFKKYFDKKNIWIVFEKNSFGAHDNAFHFFKYMYENEKHPNTYYVIRKDSPEYQNLHDMHDKVLDFMSLKYFIYMFAAKVFISSDTKFHAYNLQRRDSLLAKSMMHKKNVFLQHGMNGIKKVPVFHKKRGLLDLIIAPSDFERENINIKKWGYPGDEVVATGYARWDSYVDKTDEIPYRQIFMMPTWRKSMEGMSKKQFKQTDFYKEYQTFLQSKKLKEVLQKNNTRLAFFLHPYFKDYVDLFDIDETFTDKYGYLDVDMGEEIMKSSMMISDYSSVMWDMFYLERPVIFYQFDQADYLKSEGSYLDYSKDLFGDVVFNSEQAVNTIVHYVNNGFIEDEKYKQMRTKYMNFHDHNNSERIYKAILSKKRLLGIENKWTLVRKIVRKLWKIKKKFKHYRS